jgi:hypothetical protein
MKRITVFCGSSMGKDPIFRDGALELGKVLAQNEIELVYGGAKIGIMGTVANSILENKGRAIGVLPHFLGSKEVAHDSLTELIMVDSMHERKTKMNALCEGVIALPGGFGTLEELFEMLTWAQLGLHQKPIGLLNINGYFNHLLAFIRNLLDQGFIKEMHLGMLLVDTDAAGLIEQMKKYKAPDIPKFIKEDEL